MAKTKSYSLAPQAEGEVQLRWEGTALHILFGGAEVAELAAGREMKQGWSTMLPNGSRLEVRVLRPVLFPELAILVDGRHVDASPSHPRLMLRASAQGLLFGGALFLVLALTGQRTVDWYGVVWQALMVIGALLLLRRMYAGLVFVGLALLTDFIVIDIALLSEPGRHLIWPVFMLVLFSVIYVRSFMALHDLRRRYS